MGEFCTYTTDASCDVRAITREEYDGGVRMPDNWCEYIWHEAETAQKAIASHDQRLDEYMANQAGMTVEEYIEHG